MLLDATEDELELADRAWWLRVPATPVSPRPVFALRDDDPDDVAARSEPVLLLVLLAGMAAVPASPTARLLDKSDYDAALVAVWTFVAGGIYGAVGYFLTGFALLRRALGSLGDFRRERQLVGFALAPSRSRSSCCSPRASSSTAATRSDGAAPTRTGGTALLVVQLAFVAWSVALLVLESASCTGGAISARSRRSARAPRCWWPSSASSRCSRASSASRPALERPLEDPRSFHPASRTCAAPRGSGARARPTRSSQGRSGYRRADLRVALDEAGRPSYSPSRSCQTSTWPSQSAPAPIPIVGNARRLLTRRATGAGTASAHEGEAAGRLECARVREQCERLLGRPALSLEPAEHRGRLGREAEVLHDRDPGADDGLH